MKIANPSPIRSLFLGKIAVCGIGRPSGCRNSAVTANQSASPPTRAASAVARTSSIQKPGCGAKVGGDEQHRHPSEQRRRNQRDCDEGCAVENPARLPTSRWEVAHGKTFRTSGRLGSMAQRRDGHGKATGVARRYATEG